MKLGLVGNQISPIYAFGDLLNRYIFLSKFRKKSLNPEWYQ